MPPHTYFLHVIQMEQSLLYAVIQSLRKQAKNPTVGSTMGTTTASQTLLSFSRSARESHIWFHRGNDIVLPCP